MHAHYFLSFSIFLLWILLLTPLSPLIACISVSLCYMLRSLFLQDPPHHRQSIMEPPFFLFFFFTLMFYVQEWYIYVSKSWSINILALWLQFYVIILLHYVAWFDIMIDLDIKRFSFFSSERMDICCMHPTFVWTLKWFFRLIFW